MLHGTMAGQHGRASPALADLEIKERLHLSAHTGSELSAAAAAGWGFYLVLDTTSPEGTLSFGWHNARNTLKGSKQKAKNPTPTTPKAEMKHHWRPSWLQTDQKCCITSELCFHPKM